MAKQDTIEIELDVPSTKIIEFIRLSKKSDVYFDSWRQRTYMCKKCKAVVVSTIDHVRYHQDQLDLLVGLMNGSITVEDIQGIRYQPRQINPLKKPML